MSAESESEKSTPTDPSKSRSGRLRNVPNFAAMAAGVSGKVEVSPTKTPSKYSRSPTRGAQASPEHDGQEYPEPIKPRRLYADDCGKGDGEGDTEEDEPAAVKRQPAKEMPSPEQLESFKSLPLWVKNLEFLTEPLEGSKSSYILRNSELLRAYFQLQPGMLSELFAVYDRHPPNTALDPRSGTLYFIRTEEGLQDKSISLKSVASGPTKHTWKMAWGRKTHLKKWGILYKSYRCRHMYQPKNSPPPYRMQIYVLEEHDVDISRGDRLCPGLALVQILSLEHAPLRHRNKPKRKFEEEEEEELSDDPISPPQYVLSTPRTPFTPNKYAAIPQDMGRGLCTPRKVAQRLDLDVEKEVFSAEALGALERQSLLHDLPNPLSKICPTDHYQKRVVLETKFNQQLVTASLPDQARLLKLQYGEMSTAVLAGIVTGKPWGLPDMDISCSIGLRGTSAPCSDLTALGWAHLISLCAAHEELAKSRLDLVATEPLKDMDMVQEEGGAGEPATKEAAAVLDSFATPPTSVKPAASLIYEDSAGEPAEKVAKVLEL